MDRGSLANRLWSLIPDIDGIQLSVADTASDQAGLEQMRLYGFSDSTGGDCEAGLSPAPRHK